MGRIVKNLYWIYPALALLIYFPTRNAGFTHDFTGWFERYELYGWEGISHCFGYHRLQHFMHFLHFLLFKAAENAPWLWYAVYSILFGVTAYAVYHVSFGLMKFIGYRNKFLPVLTSFLFLIHPYQTTAVAWKVCFHYLLATFLVLTVMGLTLRWIKNRGSINIILIFTFYVFALFTHELSVSIPIISTLFAIILWITNHTLKSRIWLILVIPQFIILPIYFSLTPYLLQDTGKDRLLSEHQIDIKKQAATFFQYATKHVLMTRYWSHSAKENWNRSLQKSVVIIPLIVISLLILILFFLYYKKIPPELKLAGFSILLFAATIAPFTSAYFAYIQYTTNDMYGYAASPYILIFLITIIQRIPGRIRNVLLALYVFLSMTFLGKTIYYWYESGQVMNSLLDDFRWYDREKVYVLASVDNYRGINMLNSVDASTLDDHLFVHNGVWPDCKIEDILQFNMKNQGDGVHVTVHSPDSLTVRFNQWGNWYWKNGIGASDYETDKHQIRISNPEYHLKRLQMDTEATYIYQIGERWEEVGSWTVSD